MRPASFDNMPRAHCIDVIELLPRAPDARPAGDVKNHIHALTGGHHGEAIAEIALKGFDSQGVEFGIPAAAKCANSIAASNQLLDQIEAQKATGASYEAVHGRGDRD
jgi:hypothetical protein